MSHYFPGLCADDIASSPPPLLGDFYREPDDVVRGLTIDSSLLCFDPIGDLCGSQFSGHWEPLKPALEPAPIRNHQVQTCRFQESQEGRRVPEDPFYFYGETTQFLSGVSPSKAANRLLDFLEQEIPSSITKVNDKKFTIRADAFHGRLACHLKVYIYLQEAGCAVEFQRRKGDAIAFMGIYDKAAKYLREHIASQGRSQSNSTFASEVAPKLHGPGLKCPDLPCLVPFFEAEADNKDSSSTLIQTVRDAPYLQDEVASSILGAAEEDNLQDLAGWCEPQGVEVLLELLASDRFVCAYPAARLLARLADLPEARSHFLELGLLNSVLPRLWVQATGMAVWLQLAHLVHTLVLGYAAHMTLNESQEAAASIAAALRLEPLEGSGRTACIGQQLREALFMLS